MARDTPPSARNTTLPNRQMTRTLLALRLGATVFGALKVGGGLEADVEIGPLMHERAVAKA